VSFKSKQWVKPVLTASTEVAAKRVPAKKRRPGRSSDPKKSLQVTKSNTTVQETPASITPTVAGQLMMRPFSTPDMPAVARFTQEQIGPVFRESYGYDLDMNSVMQYIGSSQSRMILEGDQVVGYVSLVMDDNGLVNIGSLVLDTPYQSKGYGKRIMKQIEQEARSVGMSDMEVFIQSTNERSQAFAKSLGFTPVQSNQPQTVIMRKSLR
jgi:N-acetylglutamate synthase-like GNAT family acetyltransferase